MLLTYLYSLRLESEFTMQKTFSGKTIELPEDFREMVIYGLIPKDLPSLTNPNGTYSKGGKVSAHSLHAGNQILKYADTKEVKDYIKFGQLMGADYFNTCITKNCTQKELNNAINIAKKLGYVADKVVDTSYPFFVDYEVARFLDKETTTVHYDIRNGSDVLVTRLDTTFGWILGDKDDNILQAIVRHFPLAD